MSITKRLRYEVFRRDGNRCVYCGATAKDTKLTIDHVLAVALGGTDDVTNLVSACADCNAGKTSVNADEAFVARVDADTARWQRAIAAAARIRREQSEALVESIAEVDVAWNKWTYKANDAVVPLPEDWKTSIEALLIAGLPLEEMLRLVPVAMNAKTRTELDHSEWRYFMGCCKRVLREIEKTARDLLQARDDAHRPTSDRDEVPLMEGEDLCVECMKAPALDLGGWCKDCEARIAAFLKERRQRERMELDRRPPRLSELP